MRYYTYKITFIDLPCYFYYGKKKDDGKPYYGSPVTWKHLWDQFEPEVQILEWYKTEQEAAFAETALINATWKQEWNNRRYSLNENVNGRISEEGCMRGGKSGGPTCVKTKRGIFDPDHHDSVRNGSIKGGQIVSEANIRLKRGLFDPSNKQLLREASKQGGKVMNSQKWISISDGFIANAGNVAQHNKKVGIEPANRIKLTSEQYEEIKDLSPLQRIMALGMEIP